MNIDRTKRPDSTVSYGTSPLMSGTGGQNTGSFRDQMGGQLKDDYRRRVTAVLDDMEALSSGLLDKISIGTFERYIGQIRDLLSEIMRNAYVLSSEQIMDFRGRRRVLSAIEVVDQKLGDLARDVLESNSDKLDYLSKVDEIRGLLTDILL